LDLNLFADAEQLGLHMNFYIASIFEQPKVVFLVPKLFADAKGARAARPRVEKPASRGRAVRAPIAPRHFTGFVC
jgi:hypothetical protein